MCASCVAAGRDDVGAGAARAEGSGPRVLHPPRGSLARHLPRHARTQAYHHTIDYGFYNRWLLISRCAHME